MSERQKFNRWYVNTFADADGRFTHLPRWHKADVWLAWQAATRAALPSGEQP